MKFRVSAGFACAILSALALVHVYWACGETAGLSAAIPTLEGKLLLHPDPWRRSPLPARCLL